MPSETPAQERFKRCSFGANNLDELLGGGVACGSVTELCGMAGNLQLTKRLSVLLLMHRWLAGEPAAAKTQLCLQLLLTAQRPCHEGGLDGSCL